MSEHHTTGRQGQGARRRNNQSGRGYRRNNTRTPYEKKDNNNKQSTAAPEKVGFIQKVLQFFGIGKKKKKPITNRRTSPTLRVQSTPPAKTKTNTRVTGSNQTRSVSRGRPVTNSRLYVGNLSYEVAESDLQDLFKGFGDVKSVEIIYNPHTHRSKGYAFVEMRYQEDAVRAVDALNNAPYMGRNMVVSGSKDREEGNEDSDDNEQADTPEQSAPLKEEVHSLN